MSNPQPGRSISLIPIFGFQCFPEDSRPIFNKWRCNQTYSSKHSPKDLFRYISLGAKRALDSLGALTVSEEMLTGFVGHKFDFNCLNPANLNLFYGSGPQSVIWLQNTLCWNHFCIKLPALLFMV